MKRQTTWGLLAISGVAAVAALVLLAAAASDAAAQGAAPPSTSDPTTCSTRITVDNPGAGATISNSTLIRGWAVDTAQQDGSGITQVHLYLDGESGSGRFLGQATLAQFRPDVDAYFRRPSSQPGWIFGWDLGNLAPGPHTLFVYAQDACGWSVASQSVVISATMITIDRPATDVTLVEGQVLSLSGWTVDPRAASGTGIEEVRVFVDGEDGSGKVVGAARTGLPRPDVASTLRRPTAGNSGFSLDTPLPGILPGQHMLYVYARSATQGWSYRAFPFTVSAAPAQYVQQTAGRLFPSGGFGYDISFPQCNSAPPDHPYDVAVVGVTGGRAFYQNPCLATQFAWARAAKTPPMVYMNLNSPSGRTAARGNTGPARGTCRTGDLACLSYNYGFNAALHAVAYARSQGVVVPFWWLDVETENTWSDDKALNAWVIQGAIEGLRTQNLSVGIYSTPYQWNLIAGDYSPKLPVWVAGARSYSEAPTYCSASAGFGGGTVALVQYPEAPFSGNHAC